MKPFVAAACPFLAAACTAVGQTELFVAQYQFQNPAMLAMDLDGSSPRTLFAPSPADWLPLGITYNPATQRLTWMDSAGSSEIRAANADGSNPALITPVPGFCRGVSTDAGGRIYFGSGSQVMRVDADGSNLTPLFAALSGNPVGAPRVDAANGHVYVGADGEIKRTDLDGSNLKTVVRGVSNVFAIGLDIAAGHVYWVDGDTHTDFVGRCNLDDTGFTVLVDNSPGVVQSGSYTDILVDTAGAKVYWAEDILAQVFSADLDGQNRTPIYSSPAGAAPSGLVLSTGEAAQPVRDCDNNGVPDTADIAGGAPDCDNNGVLDSCQADPCPATVYLVNQGSNAASTTGRALGAPSQWQIFQPFDVPPGETWTLATIGIDGYTSNYADGSGLVARVYPDGAGGLPDETAPLASTAAFNMRFAINTENWVYAPLEVALPEGRYWVRLEASNPVDYGGSVNTGFSGLQSRSRGVSGNFSSPQSPIALRLIQGEACPADWNDDNQVNSTDISAFLTSWLDSLTNGNLIADFNGDLAVNSTDISAFLTAWLEAVTNGC